MPTPAGPGRLAVDEPPDPQAILLLGHGAGGGIEAFDPVALAFPLHPPGRPERSRAGELAGVDGPRLVVQGERDPFGTPDQVRETVPGIEVVGIPGAPSLRSARPGRPMTRASVPGRSPSRWPGSCSVVPGGR